MKRTEQTRPFVSVIMPAFNAESYLYKSIESVQAQTFTDWELLIIDDCSTDSTVAAAQIYADGDIRIRVMRNEHNIGAAETRNMGLELARGTWFAFLDSDDIWYPEKLEKQLLLAEQTGAGLIYTSYCLAYDDTGARPKYIVPSHVDYSQMLRENVIGCSTVLLKRDALGDRRFLPEIYHEDYALWLKLLRSGVTAAGCTEVLVDWRVRKHSRSFNKLSSARNRWEVYRQVEKLPFRKAAGVFTVYAFHGLTKHKRLL